MGYSLSSKLLGSAIATTMSVSQNFPKDVCLGLCFVKYWQFPVVSKLTPWPPGLYRLCHFISAIVPGGPWAPPCSTFSELFDCKRRDMPEYFWEVIGPQMQAIHLKQNFLLPFPKGMWKTRGLFLVTSCSLWSSSLHSLFVYSTTWEQSRELSLCC